MSISVRQLERFIIRPTLGYLAAEAPGLMSEAAVELLLGTAATESRFRFLDQVTTTEAADQTWGPAYGLFQMERATADDIWSTFLSFRPGLSARVAALLAPHPDRTQQLATNLSYAVAMARLRYWRAPEPLPEAGDVAGQAAYWKRHYNTAKGKGTPAQYRNDWRALVAPNR